MVATFALAAGYAVLTRGHALVGDERFYAEQARLFADGLLYHSSHPLGEVQPSAWKTPLYPTWIGSLYTVLGPSPTRVALVQSLLAPLSVLLTWAIARRWFGPTVAVVAAWIVALMPLVWEQYAMLFPETLAVPMTLAFVYLFIDRAPTLRLAVALGVATGLMLLLRPTSLFLLAAAIVGWLVVAGWRPALKHSAIAILVAVLVISPWTIRNVIVTGGFVPLSLQDAAGYGTFNDEAANDPDYPWAWRALLEGGAEPAILLDPGPDVTEAEIRSELQQRAFDYIREHPTSVPKAFVWNGIVRLWDLRPPDKAFGEAAATGNSRAVRAAGIIAHWLILPLAAVGLWRLRRRPELLAPLLTLFVTFSLSFIVVAVTRYRVPIEPLLTILAASNLPLAWRVLDRLEGTAAAQTPSR
jgi:4-amino-4-deoxy-L-arabinose transferase-like glycosyltransferase